MAMINRTKGDNRLTSPMDSLGSTADRSKNAFAGSAVTNRLNFLPDKESEKEYDALRNAGLAPSPQNGAVIMIFPLQLALVAAFYAVIWWRFGVPRELRR